MRDFRELKVWQRSHELTLAIYKETSLFPRNEIYGLTAQIRRAAVSIGANISEGAGKNSHADFARFMQISMGSASELEYELLLARDLGYLGSETYAKLAALIVETKKMLTGFIQYLQGNRKGAKSSLVLLKADG